MNPIQKDVAKGAAARAHREAYPCAKQAARRNGRHVATAHRWAESGPPQLTTYMVNAPNKWPLVAHAKALAEEGLRKETRADLVARTRALLAKEKATEGEDTVQDVSRGLNWLDRAAMKEKDAAIEEELAARFRRCAELRIPESEVFG